jgi:hypothetical protein
VGEATQVFALLVVVGAATGQGSAPSLLIDNGITLSAIPRPQDYDVCTSLQPLSSSTAKVQRLQGKVMVSAGRLSFLQLAAWLNIAFSCLPFC